MRSITQLGCVWSGNHQQVPSGSSPSHRLRQRRFEEELAASTINLKQLRRMAFHGIPEKEGLRAATWKVRSQLHFGWARPQHSDLPASHSMAM